MVINHTAVHQDVALDRIAQAHRVRLPGILYQFFIDAQGGIFQTEPLMDVVDASQPYIKNGINVAFAGSFTGNHPHPGPIAGRWAVDRLADGAVLPA